MSAPGSFADIIEQAGTPGKRNPPRDFSRAGVTCGHLQYIRGRRNPQAFTPI